VNGCQTVWVGAGTVPHQYHFHEGLVELGNMGLTQLRVGRFSQEEVDIAEETVLTLSEGVFFVKGTFEN
jgi:hypothetical protein